MRIIIKLMVIGSLLLLFGCGYDLSRKVVQQGNLLPQAKVNRLHVGMSKEDVSILMGSSLLNSPFNSDRWDYSYTLRTGAGKPKARSYTLYFSNNRLVKIDKHEN